MSSMVLAYLAERSDGATALDVARDVLAVRGPDALATRIATRALEQAGGATLGPDGRWRLAGAGQQSARPTAAVVARATGPRPDFDSLFEIGYVLPDGTTGGGPVRPERPLGDVVMERFGLRASTLARGVSLASLRGVLEPALVEGQLTVWTWDTGAAWLRAWLGVEPLVLRDVARAAGIVGRDRGASALGAVAGELGVVVPTEPGAVAWARALAGVAQEMVARAVALAPPPPPPTFDFDGVAFTADELDALPERPGVYRFLDDAGAVLYVGKARSLRARVWSYFVHRDERRRRYGELMRRLRRFEVQETGSELEALLEELRQIQALRPPLNVQVEVRERRQVGGTFAVVLPGVRDREVDVLFVRDGAPRGRVTLDRRGRGMRAARAVMKAAIFGAAPPEGDPAEAQVLASWLQSARRTHPVIPLDEVTGIQQAARLVRASVTDPELFRERIIHTA